MSRQHTHHHQAAPAVVEQHYYAYDQTGEAGGEPIRWDAHTGQPRNGGQLDVKVDGQWYAIVFAGKYQGIYASRLTEVPGEAHRQIHVTATADVKYLPSVRQDIFNRASTLSMGVKPLEDVFYGSVYPALGRDPVLTHEQWGNMVASARQRAEIAPDAPSGEQAMLAALQEQITPFLREPLTDAQWVQTTEQVMALYQRGVDRYRTGLEGDPHAKTRRAREGFATLLVQELPPLSEKQKHPGSPFSVLPPLPITLEAAPVYEIAPPPADLPLVPVDMHQKMPRAPRHRH